VLTNDIPGFKTYDEYKDAWIYEWNKDVQWVANMPWLGYGPWMEPNLPGVIPSGDVIYFESYEWYENLEEGELKDEALNSKAIFEESKGVDEEPSDEWEDFERTNNDYETQKNEGWFDEHELMDDDDDDIGDLEDYLIQKHPSYYVNEEEERSKERRCKLHRIPYVKLPTCKSEKFECLPRDNPKCNFQVVIESVFPGLNTAYPKIWIRRIDFMTLLDD
ncbi:hypothetical protein Tco_1141312, partial [Tanacetum coccineum]